MNAKMVKALSAVILMAAAVFLLSACAKGGMPERDSRILTSIRDSYGFRTYLQESNVMVSSENGRVTLTGTVHDASYHILAEEIADDTPGVESVNNMLQVEGGIPEQGSDAWLGAQVKAELMKHPNANADQTDVYVRDGIVTLRGQADSPVQRSLVTEYARNVQGVRNVINEMTLPGSAGTQPGSLGQAADDESITEMVSSALDSHEITGDLEPRIVTDQGAVTVFGVAESRSQKETVSRIIADVRGVRSVDNRMVIR